MSRPLEKSLPFILACAVGIWFLAMCLAAKAADLRFTTFDRNGLLQWTNAPVPGVCTIETADTLSGNWIPLKNAFATNSSGTLTVAVDSGNQFRRLRAVSVPATSQGFTNLVCSYGVLETIAGNGEGQTDGVSYWQPWFEGYSGAWAALSRPHFAMADRAGTFISPTRTVTWS